MYIILYIIDSQRKCVETRFSPCTDAIGTIPSPVPPESCTTGQSLYKPTTRSHRTFCCTSHINNVGCDLYFDACFSLLRDFEARLVSRSSRQFIRLIQDRPFVRIADINPMLFRYLFLINNFIQQTWDIS